MLNISVLILKLKILSIWVYILESIYSKSAYAHFLCRKVWRWLGGWVDDRAVLRIAYSNQQPSLQKVNLKTILLQTRTFLLFIFCPNKSYSNLILNSIFIRFIDSDKKIFQTDSAPFSMNT